MAASSSETCVVLGRRPRTQYRGQMVSKLLGSDRACAAFFGIPYAIAPVGLKRYQAPESFPENSEEQSPIESITTFEANDFSKFSTQLEAPKYEGSSDCLYLNIFLPESPDKIQKLLPVLVFIHGGGFITGSNDPMEFTPDNIVHRGIAFVTINYRLGLFGFMNTRTSHCPGNAGLKDQVKALEWIRDNIECFKGDPNNVTISGSSAGATCVNLHLIAPASQDLFHKAIVQSGGIFCSWGFRGHRRELIKTLFSDQKFCELFFAEQESKELQERTDKLLEEDNKKRQPGTLSPHFGPTEEKFEEGAFIPKNVDLMMQKVDPDFNKPVMAGITKEEGIAIILSYSVNNFKKCVNDDTSFCKLLMDNFRWSEETAQNRFEEIRNRYFSGRFGLSDVDWHRRFANLIRDMNHHRFYDNFKFGPNKTVHKNLYVYRFDHMSDLCSTRLAQMSYYFDDPTHGDELQYLYCSVDMKKICREDRDGSIQKVMNHMGSLWANFCKTGFPKSDFDSRNVKWRPHTEKNPCYLRINKNLELKKGPLFKDEWDWLNKLVNSEHKVQSLSTSPVIAENQFLFR